MVEFAKGQVQEFVATRDFALNFEDRNIPSVKVREGETIQYDGQVAVYTRADGDLAKGRCPGLKSAINMMQWLVPVEATLKISSEGIPELIIEAASETLKLEEGNLFEEETPVQKTEVVIPPQEGEEYDNVKGGSFDTFVNKDSGTRIVGKRGTEIIKEEDRIVKQFPAVKETEAKRKGGKLEVAGDQVEVKLVTSSTVTPRVLSKRKFEVVKGDEYGADSSKPMKTKTASAETQEKKSYTVDDTTPRATEGMSREEVQRITKPQVINADDSQDARVVRTIEKNMEVKEIEGVTLRKIESPKEMTFKKTTSPDGLKITTKVGSGSSSVADGSQQGGVVVAKIGGVKPKTNTSVIEPQEAVEVSKIGERKGAPPKSLKTDEKTGDELIADIFEEPVLVPKTPEEIEAEKKKKTEADKRAKDRAASRKKSSTQTQEIMEKKKNLSKEASAQKTEKTEGGNDYLLMLPDDWGKMHWVKKEKFIKELTDIAFIKFIQSVETIKAVQNACAERLEELEQTG